MHLTRREVLAVGAGVVLAAGGFAAEAKKRLGVVAYSYGIGRAHPPKGDGPRLDDPCDFLDHCATVGAAGMQTPLGARDAKYAANLRDKAKKHGMYVEGIVSLPKDEADVKRFEAELRFAKDCDVSVLRTVIVGDRRYEKFDTKEAFEVAVKRGLDAMAAAAPVAEKLKVRLAVENHKDFRIPDLLTALKRFDRNHVGICLDTGNSVALLEQPLDVAKQFAERTFTTHLKDMAIADYADGFLLSEVPLGDGAFDLKEIVALIDKQSQRGVRWNLEMITRDPLRVPCLTPKYWKTMPDVSALEFSERLAAIRKQKSAAPLPTIGKLSLAEQLKAEEANVQKCFQYAHDKLDM